MIKGSHLLYWKNSLKTHSYKNHFLLGAEKNSRMSVRTIQATPTIFGNMYNFHNSKNLDF